MDTHSHILGDESSRDRYNHLSSYSDLRPKGDSGEGSADYYTFTSYQDDAGTTAIYPEAGTGTEKAVNYVILGLVGEAGEIANKWKKLFRDAPDSHNSPAEYFEFYANLREDILKELGDVLWYAANLSTELGASLGEIAADNYNKLYDRLNRDVIHGSGDDR